MKCPKCQDDLIQKTYEAVVIEKCPACNGTWLDEGELLNIVDFKDENFSNELIQETINLAFAGVPDEEIRSIENCPKCEKRMKAINYDYSSGIIIDRCPDNHGVWLDKGELEKIQAHKEEWDKKVQDNHGEWLELTKNVLQQKVEDKPLTGTKEMRPTKYLINSILKKILGL